MALTYTLIASSVVGAGGASSIDFTSIPATYTDLKVVGSLRASGTNFVTIKLNSATTNFTYRQLLGNGSSAASTNGTIGRAGITDGSGDTANTFSNFEIYIPNYAGSNNKSFSSDSVTENNATTAYANLLAGLWSNTAAITAISLLSEGGETLSQYSTAYLYGIKNS